MAEDPLIHQRLVHGVERHGHVLQDLERAAENARHAQNVEGRSLSWPLVALAIVVIVAVVAALFFLYQIARDANYIP